MGKSRASVARSQLLLLLEKNGDLNGKPAKVRASALGSKATCLVVSYLDGSISGLILNVACVVWCGGLPDSAAWIAQD